MGTGKYLSVRNNDRQDKKKKKRKCFLKRGAGRRVGVGGECSYIDQNLFLCNGDTANTLM